MPCGPEIDADYGRTWPAPPLQSRIPLEQSGQLSSVMDA